MSAHVTNELICASLKQFEAGRDGDFQISFSKFFFLFRFITEKLAHDSRLTFGVRIQIISEIQICQTIKLTSMTEMVSRTIRDPPLPFHTTLRQELVTHWNPMICSVNMKMPEELKTTRRRQYFFDFSSLSLSNVSRNGRKIGCLRRARDPHVGTADSRRSSRESESSNIEKIYMKIMCAVIFRVR